MEMGIALKTAITVWLLFIAVYDYCTHRIPTWTTWPVIFALAGWWWLARGYWQVPAALAAILMAGTWPEKPWAQTTALLATALLAGMRLLTPAGIVIVV